MPFINNSIPNTMANIKNNPYLLLEQEGISPRMLGDKASQALSLFDKAALLHNKRPDVKELRDQADKAGQIASGVILKEIEQIRSTARNDIEETHLKTVKKAQSRMITEKSEQVLDDLALCRKRLKEDRQKKIESGEIAKPKKKTLVTKLREELLKIVGLIPEKLKEDEAVISRTEKAVLKFLNELKGIWGINKIKPIEDDINEKVNKLREQAA